MATERATSAIGIRRARSMAWDIYCCQMARAMVKFNFEISFHPLRNKFSFAICFSHPRWIVCERRLQWARHHELSGWIEVGKASVDGCTIKTIYRLFSLQIRRGIHARLVSRQRNFLPIRRHEVRGGIPRRSDLGPRACDIQRPHQWLSTQRRLLPRLQID